MIYLLGGPPRVGKSIVARTITQQHGINAVSTDALGAILEDVLDAAAAPGLFVGDRLNAMSVEDRIHLMAKDTDKRVEWLVAEARATWMAVPPFIQSEVDEGRDVLVEGVAVLPHLIGQLSHPDCQAVFVGNQGDNLEASIRLSAAQNEHDWMKGESEEYVGAFAMFVRQMSRYIEDEARACGYAYLELGDLPFDEAVATVVSALVEPSF